MIQFINMNKLYVKAAVNLLQLPLITGLLIFLPAWTLDYWQAWVFIAVLFICSLATTIYLAIVDPKLLERRMKVGPKAEKEKAQKIIMSLASVSFIGIVVLPAIDHRFSWSDVSTTIVILGELLIVLGFLAVSFVMRENTFSAATVEIAEGHKVISTGPYSLVRHPMYSGGLLLILGIPLALGSWWGLVMFVPTVAAIIWRLLDEEEFLKKKLPGYLAYTQKVRHRLIPHLW